MRHAGLLLTAMLMFSVLDTPSAHAEGWRDWVPFAGKDEPAAKKKKSSSTPSRSPSWGQKSKKTAKKPADDQPGMLSRMGTGTKNFFSRTKDALTWGDDSETNRPEGERVSWNDPSPYRQRKEEKSSWWNFWRRDASRPSETVEDFMSQERPEHAQ